MSERTLVEDLTDNDGFGWRVKWRVSSHQAEFWAYEVTGVCLGDDAGKPLFHRNGAQSSPDDVLLIDEAEVFAHGRVKWDGCSDWTRDYCHHCSADAIEWEVQLMRYIYCRASELIESADFTTCNKPIVQWKEVAL